MYSGKLESDTRERCSSFYQINSRVNSKTSHSFFIVDISPTQRGDITFEDEDEFEAIFEFELAPRQESGLLLTQPWRDNEDDYVTLSPLKEEEEEDNGTDLNLGELWAGRIVVVRLLLQNHL